jgi:superfamily I DNA/RNA helicase
MATIHTVWASAGCGKTEFCTRLAADMLARGVCSKEEILYATFQRAAAQDAAARAGIRGDEYRRLWYRTLHSTCLKLLRVPRESIVTPSKMRKFGERLGVQINDDIGIDDDEAADIAQVMLAIERTRTLSDDAGTAMSKVIAMYQHSRLTAASAEDLRAARREPSAEAISYFGHIDWSGYAGVVELYESWKGGQLVDFVDMLEKVILEPINLPPWKVAFIDEAQDMSPLLWLCVEKLLESVEISFLVGDDWQAIFSFAGSSAEHFLSYRTKSRKIHLPQTHRFNQSIIDLGQRIVNLLPNGEPKNILPDHTKNNPIRRIWSLDDAPEYPGKKFYLHRHREGCNAIARQLIMAGKPFWCERGVNPLGKPSHIAGYNAIKKLLRLEPLDGGDIQSMLGVIGITKEFKGEKIKLLKHGSNAQLKRMEVTQTISPLELSTQHFTSFLWDALRAGDWGVTDVTFAEYYSTLVESGFDLGGGQEPDITISTIHGSKGRDADEVFLWDELLPKCLRDQNEHRVWYVGVTRTKGPLHIVSTPATTWNTAAYPHMVNGD